MKKAKEKTIKHLNFVAKSDRSDRSINENHKENNQLIVHLDLPIIVSALLTMKHVAFRTGVWHVFLLKSDKSPLNINGLSI